MMGNEEQKISMTAEGRVSQALLLAALGAVVLAAGARPALAQDWVALSDSWPTAFLPHVIFTDDGQTQRLSMNYMSGDSTSTWEFQNGDFVNLYPFAIGGPTSLVSQAGGILRLHSESVFLDFMVDADNNQLGEHSFVWYTNGCCPAPNIQQILTADHPTHGNKHRIRGTYQANQGFDVAESFWESEPIEPGEVVAIDPGRRAAVRRSQGAYDSTVLGVSSSKPGLLLGGAPFTAEDLGVIWGEEILRQYQNQRAELVQRALSDDETLRDEVDNLASPGAFAAYLELAALQENEPLAGERAPTRAVLSPEALSAALEERRQRLAFSLEDRAMALFFEERFASVALSGRVPVKADTSSGAISPGDYLTSGPVPGTAMKATQAGPVIGMALEGLASGSGVVQVFVQPGWRGGSALRLGVHDTVAELAAKDEEIAKLQSRVARLESVLAWFEPEPPAPSDMQASAEYGLVFPHRIKSRWGPVGDG